MGLLLEQLLREAEGPALDFKRDQYPFDGAADELKSELLKDILAFANAWRRSDAYIVIGVEETDGVCTAVVGVASHLEDANLQQFVSAKAQRPVHFAYHAVEYQGKQLGMIHIPLQQRPCFVRRRFGRVESGTVYVRRGSAK